MGLGIMDHIMNPSRGLLHANGPPLILTEETIWGNILCQLLWQNNMSTIAEVMLV